VSWVVFALSGGPPFPQVNCSTSQLNRSATSGDVVVDGQGLTLSETCADRPTLVVLLGSSDNVTLQNLTLTTDGASLAGGFEMDGGTGNLTLNGVTMTNNHNAGGGAVEIQVAAIVVTPRFTG
jgi:hypothetical protein